MASADDFACSWRARQKHEKRKAGRRTQRTRSRESKPREDPLNAIRKKVVRNAEQLEALKSSIKMNETLELSRETAYINRRATEALAFLIHRMACELRKPPRLPMGPHRSKLDIGAPLGEQSKQGVTYTRVRIAAACEQRVFESLGRRVQEASEKLRAAPASAPDYELTQLPPYGCSHFTTTLGYFSDLCHCIGINSISDRLNMMQTFGMKKGEGCMRILDPNCLGGEEATRDAEFLVVVVVATTTKPITWLYREHLNLFGCCQERLIRGTRKNTDTRAVLEPRYKTSLDFPGRPAWER